MKLLTIQEHNERIRHMNNNHYCGIECPNCKEEMQNAGRGVMLTSPPQKDIKCFSCGYTNRVYC